MGVIADLIKLALIPIVLIAVPILFILIFDLAAHLRELFGQE